MTRSVGTASAEPGQKAFGVLPIGTQADGTPLDVPVCVVAGAQPGATLYVQAAVHGAELNGVEALRRVLTELDPAVMSGTLIAVSVVNTVGFTMRERNVTFDNEDMNRVWPGKANGRLSQRIAYHVYSQAIQGAAALIDLHTGGRTMLTHCVYAEGDAGSRELAQVFGSAVLLQEQRDETTIRARFDGKLRNVVNAGGIPAITPELGGSYFLDEPAVLVGVTGIRNVLVHMGILPGTVIRPPRQITIGGSHLSRVYANHGGLFIPAVQVGQMVEADQPLGNIYRVRDWQVVEQPLAPTAGLLWSLSAYPTVHTGDGLAGIGMVL